MTSITAFVLFAFSAMVTPGPNNLMIMHSGLNFGIKRTIRHFLGILFGVMTIFILVGFGLGYFMEKFPIWKTIIKILGSFYMLFLAVKISQMNENKTNTNISKPLTFTQAALFQWVNPKAWIIALTMSGMFHVCSNVLFNTILLVIVINIINMPCLAIWMYFGRFIERIIKNNRQRKIFNLLLGFLLALSVVILWI